MKNEENRGGVQCARSLRVGSSVLIAPEGLLGQVIYSYFVRGELQVVCEIECGGREVCCAGRLIEIEREVCWSGKSNVRKILEAQHSKLNIPPFAGAVGEGDREACEEGRAMSGYEAYSNYLEDEGAICPEWHELSDELKLAFIEFAARVAEGVRDRVEQTDGSDLGGAVLAHGVRKGDLLVVMAEEDLHNGAWVVDGYDAAECVFVVRDMEGQRDVCAAGLVSGGFLGVYARKEAS